MRAANQRCTEQRQAQEDFFTINNNTASQIRPGVTKYRGFICSQLGGVKKSFVAQM
jgi:hypothetical protein